MIPHTIKLEAGGAICASVVNGKVLLVVSPNATLTRAECEHLGDALYAVGAIAEPKRLVVTGRAKPITSVSDERVKGAPPPPPEPPPPRKVRSWP